MLKRRLIVVVDVDDCEPEKTAMACLANVNGLSHIGTLHAGNGILIKLAHDNFPPIPEESLGGVCVCFLDIRNDGLTYQHYPSWSEVQERYALPSILDKDVDD